MDTQTTDIQSNGWMRRIGRRNIAYVVFVILLFPLAYLLEQGDPSGPDAGGGWIFGFIIWGVVSLVFFLANAGLLIAALAKSRPVRKPFVACLLPALLIVGTLLAEEIMLR